MKIILFANTDWYLYNYRLPLARALCEKGHKVLLVSPEGQYAHRMLENGFNWQRFKLSRRGLNPIYEVSTILRLIRLYKREQPNIVHHFTTKCVLYGSIASQIAGIKKIINAVTGLGYVYSNLNAVTAALRPIISCLYKIALRKTRIVFQNQHDRDIFIEKGLAQENQCTVIASSGVDVDKYKNSPIPSGEPLIILPARMLLDKGVFEFVEAAKILRASGVKARCVLVGKPDEGNPRSISESQLNKWANTGAVEWWGWQEDMVSAYQKASVVCLPSYYGEGLAKSLIEGAASGRALVASDIPGCREVIEDGVNGLLVPTKAAPILANALKKIIYNSKMLKKMGDASRKKAVRYFSQQKIVAETLDLYDSLLLSL